VPGHYSPPLSDLNPASSPKTTSIPACAVFNFDDNYLVTQLAIYMDRYHFISQLTVTGSQAEISDVLERLSQPNNQVINASGRRITITIQD
jgi:hypothetical protein